LAKVVGAAAALVSATSRAADTCSIGDAKGRLRAGCDADVLVVGGDLSAGLDALSDVRQVVLRGAVA
jgi:imidazolonepropionase-like amidohydrolase